MGVVVSPVSGGQALRAFRLAEVPESIRLAAAVENAELIARSLKRDRAGYASSEDEQFAALDAAVSATAFALNPPPGVHWVSQAAWDRMIERAERLS